MIHLQNDDGLGLHTRCGLMIWRRNPQRVKLLQTCTVIKWKNGGGKVTCDRCLATTDG